jgi:hypothetical protein
MRNFILIIALVSAASLGYILYRHPIILKAATGSARVLSPPLDATIKINGVVQPSAKCFEMKSLWDGSHADSLVLWLNDLPVSRDVLIVDKQYRDVGSPNAGETNYDLLMGRYLFQAESAVPYASFKDEKSYAQDPKLEVGANHIKFVVPKGTQHDEKVIEVIYPSASTD